MSAQHIEIIASPYSAYAIPFYSGSLVAVPSLDISMLDIYVVK